MPAMQSLHGPGLLSTLSKHWNNHRLMLKWLTKFFQYLDRFYVKMENVMPLRQKGLDLFRMLVFGPVKRRVTGAVLEEINRSRDEELIDESLLKGIIEIFIETDMNKSKLQLYEDDFEVRFREWENGRWSI